MPAKLLQTRLRRTVLLALLAFALLWPSSQIVATTAAKKTLRVMTYMGERMRAKKAWVVETLASDHIPVVAELEIK